MGQIIDIRQKITNELPLVQITDELVVSVNNRKNTILNMQAMVKEEEKKAKETEGYNELDLMEKSLKMLIGEKPTEAIENLDLPFPEYKAVYQAIMAAATGTDLKEVESRFQNGQ